MDAPVLTGRFSLASESAIPKLPRRRGGGCSTPCGCMRGPHRPWGRPTCAKWGAPCVPMHTLNTQSMLRPTCVTLKLAQGFPGLLPSPVQTARHFASMRTKDACPALGANSAVQPQDSRVTPRAGRKQSHSRSTRFSSTARWLATSAFSSLILNALGGRGRRQEEA